MGLFDSDWIAGDWNAVCDICGLQYKASELVENWKNQRVCRQDFEGRHPQQFVRVRPEKISTDWSRLPGSSEVWTGADVIGPFNNTVNAPTANRLLSIDCTGGSVIVTLNPPPEYATNPRLQVSRVDTASGNTCTVQGFTIAPQQAILIDFLNGTWKLFGRQG